MSDPRAVTVEGLREEWPWATIVAKIKHVGGGRDSWMVWADVGQHTRIYAHKKRSHDFVWKSKRAACKALDGELAGVALDLWREDFAGGVVRSDSVEG